MHYYKNRYVGKRLMRKPEKLLQEKIIMERKCLLIGLKIKEKAGMG